MTSFIPSLLPRYGQLFSSVRIVRHEPLLHLTQDLIRDDLAWLVGIDNDPFGRVGLRQRLESIAHRAVETQTLVV